MNRNGRKFGLIIILTVFAIKILGFGPPNWADPYVKNFCPKDCKIVSKDDEWAAIYMETEFSISPEGTIVRTKRALLENLSDVPKNFLGVIFFDSEKENLGEVELKIQSKYRWRKIKVEERSSLVDITQSGNIAFISSESIPPHNKVAWEYSIVEKSDIIMWEYEYVTEVYPVLEKRVMITQFAKTTNYHLRYVDNNSTNIPDCFSKLSEDSYLVKEIPSALQLSIDYSSPFYMDCIYPYFIFEKKDKKESMINFAHKYLEKWEKSITENDNLLISETANNLTKDKNSLEDKIRAIANFVQFDISYDGSYTKGEFGLIPLSSVEVLRSRRGDCKGKVLLAQSLFNKIGVKSDVVLLRYSGVYYPTKIDSISQSHFNHIVLAIELENSSSYDATIVSGPAIGKILFDPTSKSTLFGSSPPGLEGMLGFMPKYPKEDFFEIHLKVPAIWKFLCQAEVEYDQFNRINAKLTIIDNGISFIQDFTTRKGNSEENKNELLKLYSEIFPNTKIVSYEIRKPPQTKVEESVLNVRIENPFYELQKSFLFINPWLIPLQGTFFLEKIGKGKKEQRERITLSPPWDRKINQEGFFKKLEVEMDITFETSPLFPLPENFILKKEWLDASIKWSKVKEKMYSAKLAISFSRGIWEKEKYEERINDIKKIESIITNPLRGYVVNHK